MNTSNIKLGYWKIRGIAQPIRYMLEYLKVSYSEATYIDIDSWGREKFNLGLDFPNLPFLTDQEKKLTESWAIIQYIATKFSRKDLIGITEDDKIKISMVYGVVTDIRSALF